MSKRYQAFDTIAHCRLWRSGMEPTDLIVAELGAQEHANRTGHPVELVLIQRTRLGTFNPGADRE